MSKLKKNTGRYAKILKFVNGSWRYLILAFVLNIIFSLFETMSIALIQPIIKILFGKGDASAAQETVAAGSNIFENIKNEFYNKIGELINTGTSASDALIRLSILVIASFALKNVFKYFSSVIGTRASEGIIKNMRDTIFRKLTSLSVDFFSRSRQGHLISVLTNDVTMANNNTIASISSILKESTQIIIFMMLLLGVSPYLTAVAFSTSIISFGIIRIAVKYLKKYAGRMQAAMSNYTTSLQEMIFGIRIIKAYNAEPTINNKFFSQTAQYVRSVIKHKKVVALVPSLNEIFAIFALCVVLYIGGSQVLSGEMRGEDLILFLFTLFSIMSPLSSFLNQISMIQTGMVAADRIFTVIDTESSIVSGSEKVSAFTDKMELKDICFAYNAEKQILDKCNVTLEKGKKIAFVGSSGSGKSTMLDLIIRFYDPQSGAITLDGTNIRKFNTKDYRSLFGIVSQETVLFNDTVENNIKYGVEATDAEVEKAAAMANALTFIKKMPQGMKTVIGDRGVLISGGERQRISIARALLRNPQILIFDEATSALDSESEKIVQDAINASMEDKTAVLVAHRLSTIRSCDCIYVFDAGKIAEFGTHEELTRRNGIYKKLCDIQNA